MHTPVNSHSAKLTILTDAEIGRRILFPSFFAQAFLGSFHHFSFSALLGVVQPEE